MTLRNSERGQQGGHLPQETRLIFNALSVEYGGRRGRRVSALKDLTFAVSDGEFVSVIGPSGCGKSTMLRVAAGLLSPTHGDVRQEAGEPETSQRRDADASMVFQDSRLLPWMAVIDNVSLPLRARGMSKVEAQAQAHEMIHLVGLSEFADNYPHQLSGGMQQRVGVARALVTRPNLLLLDEPFGALDALTRELLNIELMEIWMKRRTTVLLVTHAIEEAIFLSNRVLIMSPRPGRIVHEFGVELEYPRSPDAMTERPFAALVNDARHILYAEASIS